MENLINITIYTVNIEGDVTVIRDTAYGDQETVDSIEDELCGKLFTIEMIKKTDCNCNLPSWQAVSKAVRKTNKSSFVRFGKYLGFNGKIMACCYVKTGIESIVKKFNAAMIDDNHCWIEVASMPFNHK